MLLIQLILIFRRLAFSKSKSFLTALLFFISGVGLARFFVFNPFIIFLIFLFLSSLVVIFFSKKELRIFLIICACFFFGFWRYQVSLPDFNDQEKVYAYNFYSAMIEGRVVNVDRRINLQKLTIETEKIKLGKESKNVSGLVLVNTSLFPEVEYGRLVRFSCKLKRPEKLEDFDYAAYLSRYDIYITCYSESPRYFDNSFLSWRERSYLLILKFRNRLASGIRQFLPEPQASIMEGMIVGLSQNIPAETKDLFARLGLTHIIAISGSHITLIASLLMSLMLFIGFSRGGAFWFSIAGIFFYTILVGAPASALRAAVMGAILLFGQRIGRVNKSGPAIAFAGAIMLLFNPKLLIFDVGFQLSFLAVLGLIYLYPLILKSFEKWPNWLNLKDMLAMTLAAQIATLPLIVFVFGRFSFLSLPANILILPSSAFLMVYGFISALVGALVPFFNSFIGYPSYLVLSYWLLVSNQLIKLDYLNFDFKPGRIAVLIIGYALILFWLYNKRKKRYE